MLCDGTKAARTASSVEITVTSSRIRAQDNVYFKEDRCIFNWHLGGEKKTLLVNVFGSAAVWKSHVQPVDAEPEISSFTLKCLENHGISSMRIWWWKESFCSQTCKSKDLMAEPVMETENWSGQAGAGTHKPATVWF